MEGLGLGVGHLLVMQKIPGPVPVASQVGKEKLLSWVAGELLPARAGDAELKGSVSWSFQNVSRFPGKEAALPGPTAMWQRPKEDLPLLLLLGGQC